MSSTKVYEEESAVEGTLASVAFAVDAVGVEANGSQTLTYQWFKEGSPLSNGGSISGADARALLIRGVQPSDAGSYCVLVSNAAGSVSSSTAKLTTVSLP